MSIEPWRKRGFVPDSDEEDEFDSLDAQNGPLDNTDNDVDLEYLPIPTSTTNPAPKDVVKDQEPEVDHTSELSTPAGSKDAYRGSLELVSSPKIRSVQSKKHGRRSGEITAAANDPSPAASSREQTPRPRRALKTYGKRSSATKEASRQDTERQDAPSSRDEEIWDIPTSPVQEVGSSRKSRRRGRTSQPSTPSQPSITVRPKIQNARRSSDAGTSRSSSPDELNVVGQSSQPPLQPHHDASDNELKDAPRKETPEDDSPLSSPPLSPHPPPDIPETAPGDPPAPLQNVPDPTSGHLDHLDVPVEILEQFQPARRSFRERNAIQLHPYALEMAKYQTQMKAGGVRPVRMAVEQERRRAQENTDESQEQDSFDPDAVRSSPPAEEYLPPTRPERHRERDINGHEHQPSHIRRTQSFKRRKKSRSGVWQGSRHSSEQYARPQVVIQNNTPPRIRNGPSVFEIPSSPSSPGSTSSAARTPRAAPSGFRFPPGFTPPPTTTTGGESKSATPGADEPNVEPRDVDASASSESEQDSDASQGSAARPNETAEEREIRRIQRQTRGVLPASWVRLEAQQRLAQQKPDQQNRHAAPNRTDGKGVARKVVRKAGQTEGSNPREQHGLIDLADSDDSDEDNQNQNVSNRQLAQDVEEGLDRDVRAGNSFAQDADIMEDNRIDYMLPTMSRNQSDSHGRRKGLKRLKPKESAASKERQAKKARLKRQTRLTDTSYGSRRTKRPSTPSAPRLGILDAPDVASQPRKEQPHFLRVAARRARKRQDKGRQSPTRKFLQLGSKTDTADANQSLRDWKRGSIRQTKIDRPQSKPRKRQPLANISNGPRPGPASARKNRTLDEFAALEPDLAEIGSQPAQQQPSTVVDAIPSAPPAPSANDEGAARPPQPEQRGHQWIVRRNAAISSLQRNNIRPAATSLTGPAASQAASQAVFNRSLGQLNQDYRQKQLSRPFKPSLTLDRYLSDTGPLDPSAASSPNTAAAPSTSVVDKASPTRPQPTRRRLRKQMPKRINLESEDFVQDEEPAPAASDPASSFAVAPTAPTGPSFFSAGGLYNWQRSYSVDFGAMPLRNGTFFHESTFIGSGEFLRSLQISKRDLDQNVDFSSVLVRDQDMQWGPWNEKVSSEMGAAFDVIIEDVEKSIPGVSETTGSPVLAPASFIYRSIVKYVTENLSFIDPVDRTSFVNRAKGLVFKLRDFMASFLVASDFNPAGMVRIACFNLVFSNQIRQVASHPLVSPGIADDLLDLVKSSARDILALIMSNSGMSELGRLFEDNKKPERREAGIREEFPSAEAYLVARQLLRSSETLNGVLEDVQIDACVKGVIRNNKDVVNLETAWRGLFMILPLDEVDHHGIARRDTRFKTAHVNWPLVKGVLSPTLDQYGTNSATQPISYNAYCRTLFQRCHRLINFWGWRDCKPILDALYDFFANITLYNLRLEESRGSPAFLDELDQNPSLDVRPGEPCFHTLLKIIASGFRYLSLRYDKKKIRNFAWRLLPNHGRVYPKEMPLRHEDLDALRNHHDLLCTLYWVSPDGFRPRLEIIRDLVSPATSHRETCSINIRSWTRLVRFKLSTKEDASGLEPFADWHSYFLTELRQEHSNARKEIEAQSKDGEWVSKHVIESTISQNQRQIESLLSMALSGLQTAVGLAPSLEHAYRLMLKTPFESLLALFNPKLARVNVVVSETLQVMVAYTRKDTADPAAVTNNATPAAAAPIDEDSQEFEYGDWSDIDEVLVQQTPPSEGVEHVQKALHPLVSRLVSNCFGEDHCPEDAILINVVDCWTSLANVLVRHGLKQWDNYLNPFGDEAWTRLRETVQTRKFAPHFLASCINKDARVLSECRIQAMGMWISSLAERSLMLKFQHCLTEALLNGSPNDPLLQNLPFTKDKRHGRYAITLEDLTQRRLSLISSLLSNMREHVLQLEVEHSRDLSVTKQEYSELLQRLMAAMKENYRELGNGAVESAQGAYVDFVHHIIRFLQELTSDIRPIDPFFTDPALFPLPSSDPRYIVAKLKRYEPKLSSKKELQTLTMFIQSIVERATVERQQSHLVDQLHTAMKDTYEAGRPDKPTLRAALLQSVFPAYLELAFSTPAAWILSWPIIQSVSLVFRDLLFSLDTNDPTCVTCLLKIFDTTFLSIYRALRPLSHRPSRLQNPAVLAMLAAIIKMISSSLIVVDYLDRTTDAAESCVSYIRWFRDFSNALVSHLSTANPGTAAESSITTIQPPDVPSSTTDTGVPQHLATARHLAFEDHQSYLRNWSFHDGKYYYTRSGHDSREVFLSVEVTATMESVEISKKAFEESAAEFTTKLGRLDMLP